MAATYQVDVFHGSGPTSGAWPAGGRFHRADTDPTTDAATTYIPVPASGSAYSWRKHFKLNVTAAPTGTVSNLRWFSDATAWGTGITAYAKTSSTYSQATSADNTTLMTSAVDVTTYTSGSPLTINSGTVLTAATGYGTQDFLVMQVGVSTTAGPGTTAARTLTYRVDET